AGPAEEAGTSDGQVASELKEIAHPSATAEAIVHAKEAVNSDTLDVKYDVPITINDAVLKVLAAFQSDLHGVISRGLGRSGKYMPMIHRVFEEEGIPKDLAQIALIESSFLPRAHSRASAHGIWQFMPRTGRQYGLTANSVVDERSDPEKATRAAARYLGYLHQLFDDWYLAMAAYNAGEGKIMRAMQRTGARNFWELAASGAIKPETRNYVPAFIAATLIARNPLHYGFEVEYAEPLDYETVLLDRPVHLKHLAASDAALDDLKGLNPELQTAITPRQPEGYELKVPPGARAEILLAFAGAPTATFPVAKRRHTVRRGETLARIAKKYRVSVASLASANSLSRKARVMKGRVLVIPGKQREAVQSASLKKGKKGRTEKVVVAAKSKAKAPARRTSSRHYKVRTGDTLYRIALKHGTTVAGLLAINSLPSRTKIRPGDRLKVPSR
ncbi:MAG TPA: transglycosylase SLT domain-containing protein, partial [Thermoanaerobaculia bacterium]|nr:transglycosylase SLT domain-containing protein [Thermoanaerobaculia bacterium]